MPDLHPTKESGGFIEAVAYEAAVAQRNRYREAHARLEHQVEWLKAERDALREGLHEIMRLPHGAVSPAVKDAVRRALKDPYP